VTGTTATLKFVGKASPSLSAQAKSARSLFFIEPFAPVANG